MVLRSAFWPVRYSRWASRPPQQPGYTLLLPVPGDLPVFLDLALAVCRTQRSADRVATVVIPDRDTPVIAERVEQAAAGWDGPLELLPLPLFDRVLLPRLGDPGRFHGAQLIRGVSRARSSHIVLHDADLFLMDPDVHQEEFTRARDGDLDALGVSPPWDSWYAERGRRLAATWELCGRVDWLRAHPPHRHLGHVATVDGEEHMFDTTFWAQLHTPAERIAVADDLADRVVHFNYVISTYRRFQRSTGSFHDDGFRLLLIRLFVDLFAQEGDEYQLPSLDELVRGLGRADEPGVRVAYELGDRDQYAQMRGKLRAMVTGPWSDPARTADCLRLLQTFDDFYGLSGAH